MVWLIVPLPACVSQFPTEFTGGIPRRLDRRDECLWVVPIVLTSPGYGIVGFAGVVAIDESGRVAGSTPRQEVIAAEEGKCDAIEAAFLSARKT
jgi:hypothetical protein